MTAQAITQDSSQCKTAIDGVHESMNKSARVRHPIMLQLLGSAVALGPKGQRRPRHYQRDTGMRYELKYSNTPQYAGTT